MVQWSAADAGATAVSLLLVQCIGDDKVEILWFSSERRLRANHKQQRRKRRNKFPSPGCHSTCPSAWQDHPKTEITFPSGHKQACKSTTQRRAGRQAIQGALALIRARMRTWDEVTLAQEAHNKENKKSHAKDTNQSVWTGVDSLHSVFDSNLQVHAVCSRCIGTDCSLNSHLGKILW